MNYSTLKKALVFSLVAVLGLSEVSLAQEATSSSAKVFGGRSQYRSWNLGVNAGVLAPVVMIGGTNDFSNWSPSLGYGVTLRKQLDHIFGLQLAYQGGQLSYDNDGATVNLGLGSRTSGITQISNAIDVTGVANVGSVDFLKRENALNFNVKAGMGVIAYNWKEINPNATPKKGTYGPNKDRNNIRNVYFPVGASMKFKVSERVNFDLGYTMNFLDADDLDGTKGKSFSKDKWSYASAGVEFSLGSSAKSNLDWVNPLAMMYDELKDPTLRQEVEALKGRVSALEAADLLKDADGDGVADKLDKCPNTEAGIKVDGSGCPLDVDGDGIPDSKDACPTVKGIARLNGCPEFSAAGPVVPIQFEFNSSVLRTSAYSVLDGLGSSLKANTSAVVQLDGHASAEGTQEYNMTLSRDRANSVKTYLVNAGIASNRVATTAYGESRPIASNATEAGRSQNRRVEIKQQ
jgi:OOP family OmpA-OmpF porin